MSVKDDLIAAKALIADPACWFKGAYKSMNGAAICASQAIIAVLGDKDGYTSSALWNALSDARPEGFASVSGYNDDPKTTHGDIMALFDRAINAADAAIASAS